MNFKNKTLTFERTLSFDGMTDSYTSGSKELVSGKCVKYSRNGWHRYWNIIKENGEKETIMSSFDTLKAVDGRPVKEYKFV